MAKKPMGADWNFYDGEWIFPYALLALSTLYWDIGWTRLVLIVMFFVACFHIMYEHRVAFGKKEVNTRRLYNLIALGGSFFIALIMPVYMAVSYSIFASKLKKDGEEAILAIKKKTYTRMFVILAFAVLVNLFQGMLYANEISAAMKAEQEQTQGVPGTIQ